MTARKSSSWGDPCGLFLSWGRPSPRQRMARPPRETEGKDGTVCRAGVCSRGSLRIPRPRKGTCGKCLPGEGISRPPPRKRGGRLIRRGQPAPAGDWGTALPGWELVPGELENSPPTKGDLREVPPGGRDKPPAPKKTGRASHSPGAARPCRGLGNRPAGLGACSRGA